MNEKIVMSAFAILQAHIIASKHGIEYDTTNNTISFRGAVARFDTTEDMLQALGALIDIYGDGYAVGFQRAAEYFESDEI